MMGLGLKGGDQSFIREGLVVVNHRIDREFDPIAGKVSGRIRKEK